MRLVTLLLRAFACTALAGLAAGCAFKPIEPWVKPYERERLADPIMQFTGDPLLAQHREHIYTTREGARGANGVEGGGCGCN